MTDKTNTDGMDVPAELMHLIEKRKSECRRKDDRRGGIDRRMVNLGPLGAVESVEDLENVPLEERRSEEHRRGAGERRESARRASDVDCEGPDESQPEE